MTASPTPGAAPASPAARAYDRTLVRWGQGTEMSALQAARWHVSARTTLRAATVVVELLDLTPDWERVRKGHAWAVGRVPRLRQRVVSDPLRIGPPAWADTRVDLDRHLQRVRLGPKSTFQDALEVAAGIHAETFDLERPLWRAALVEGLPDGAAAYVLKLHHAMADDHAVIALFDLIHSRVREPSIGPPELPDGIDEPITPAGLARRHALSALHQVPVAAARSALAGAQVGAALARRPWRGATVTTALARTAATSLAGGSGAGSPLLARRGPDRAFVAIDVPTDFVRAAGGPADGRLGDTLLAVLADGLGRYHQALGVPRPELPIAVPLTLRLDGSDHRYARARISAPVGPMPPTDRIRVLRERVACASDRPRVDLVKAAAPFAGRTPTALLGPLLERSARPLALQTFVTRGLDRDAYLAGAQVQRMFSFAPTGGCAVSATLVTHQEHCCLGLSLDTAAVTDRALLRDCMRDALAELLSAAGDDGGRSLPRTQAG